MSLQTPMLTDDEFRRISDRVRRSTGIVLKEHKSVMVHSRISRRLRDLGIGSINEYMDFLESPGGAAETTNFCNAITTNLTSFFREPHHFEHLKAELKGSTGKQSRLRIWSAGCSTGEEPHCIAMVVASNVAQSCDAKVLATDLDTNVLEKAMRGRYALDKHAAVPAEYKSRFTQADSGGKEFAVTQEATKLISFRQLNLLSDWPIKGPFDFIFCRNVLIYFDGETKANLINRYAELLRPNGVLYLGHSETILEEHPMLMPEGRTTYRKKA